MSLSVLLLRLLTLLSFFSIDAQRLDASTSLARVRPVDLNRVATTLAWSYYGDARECAWHCAAGVADSSSGRGMFL